ncbi:DNA polymerase [Lentzea sp. JNUCC 0626]|uniref:DNA polymerase n=1 Tax=Lentzea sp. JNUCC 0626 TaxID=3367513 RepID=UPI003747F8EC
MKTFKYRVDREEVTIYFPETEDDLAGFRRFLNAAPRVIGLDTETTGLRIYSRGFRCRLVQFGDAREAWVLQADRFRAEIIRALARPELRFVAHNAPFDLLVLDRVGLASLEDLGPRVFDTYILAHLCDPRTDRDGGAGLKLKQLAAVYVDNDAADTQDGLNSIFLEMYRAWKKTVSRDEIQAWQQTHAKKPHTAYGFTHIAIDHPLYVTYAGLDVVYTARLLAELGLLIKGAGLTKLAQFEHRVQLITTHQQRRGLLIDVEYTKTLAGRLEEEAETYRHVAKGYGVDNVNSTRQVIEALRGMGEVWSDKTDTGNPAVGKEVLLPMADLNKDWQRVGVRDPNPLADAIVRAKRAEKWKESYAVPFLTDRDENDRIHPSIKSLAARTARMSVSGPPLQQLPSGDWTIRRAVLADPGHLIVAADYSAVEMRVLAALADVREMKRLIAEGADLHTATAIMVYGQDVWDAATPKQRKRMRSLMKTVGFGKVYGGGATGLSKQSGLPYADVKNAVDRYDVVYPEIPAYGRLLQRQAAYKGGAVYTPVGRRLPLDRDRAYAATNYVVQSSARDVLAQALCRIDDAGMSHLVLLPVHDELVCQAPAGEAEEVIREIGRLMETTVRDVFIQSEPEVYGRSWGAGYMSPDDRASLDAA